MILALAFFIAGFFINPWPIGVMTAVILSAILTFSIRGRYTETRRRMGVAIYLKVLAFAFAGSSISFVALMYLSYFTGRALGMNL